VRGNYELSVDNLMDLGHALYLHRASAGDFGDVRPQHEVTQEGLRVRDMRLYPATPLPAGMARQYNLTPGELKDISTDIEWSPVGLIQNNICVAPVGQARVTGLMSRGVHCLTPETETSTHYFYANVRNYMIHDERIDELFREWQSNALQGEDGAMVEAIQRNLDAAERCSIAPVFLSTDAAPSRVRRVLATLLADEAAPSDIGLVEQASGGGRHP
jgi:vanillate O-demethylase monooxygenase subunit